MLIHDQSPFAWVVVLAYLAAAMTSLWAVRSTKIDRDRRFWAGTAVLLILLGLNKQLDLQTLLTEAGRWMARQEGWYGYRRLVQAAFILLLAAAAFLSLAALSAWLRRSAASVKIAASGIVILFGFILLRAASFHHMDLWVARNAGAMRGGWWLELAGILIIAGSALIYASHSAASAEDGAQG